MGTFISRDSLEKKGNVFFVQRYFFIFKVVLLVTDGKQSTLVDSKEKGPIQESKDMQARGIDVHAMGVGQVDPIELLKYASDQSFILRVEDFTKLDAEVTKQANNLCPRKFQNLVRKIMKIRLDLKPIFMCHFCCSWESSANSSICKSRCSSSRRVDGCSSTRRSSSSCIYVYIISSVMHAF